MAVASSHPPMQSERGMELCTWILPVFDTEGSNVSCVCFSSLTMFDAYTGADLMSRSNHGLPNSTNPIRPKKLDRSNECMGLVGANIVDLELEKIRHNPSWKLYIKQNQILSNPTTYRVKLGSKNPVWWILLIQPYGWLGLLISNLNNWVLHCYAQFPFFRTCIAVPKWSFECHFAYIY